MYASKSPSLLATSGDCARAIGAEIARQKITAQRNVMEKIRAERIFLENSLLKNMRRKSPLRIFERETHRHCIASPPIRNDFRRRENFRKLKAIMESGTKRGS